MVESAIEWGWDRTGPVWGARAFKLGGGQDHLGLGSVSSDRILPLLSPGINVLTIHPRYTSFYAWVLHTFWSQDLPRSRASFRDFFRPREALYSMACHVCDANEHDTLMGNVVGSQRVQGIARGDEFNPQFNYIKEALGGYGLYYRSTMEMMGALVTAKPNNGFPFDALTPVGRALAAAFADAISDTAMYRRMLDSDLTESVPRDELAEFAARACLCQMRAAKGHDLPLLQDLYLHAGDPEQTAARRRTLQFMLDLSQSAQDRGIDHSEFRQRIFFRTTAEQGSDPGSSYEPQSDLVDVARRWRIYQAREYFAFAFNRLFGWIARRGLAESADGLVAVPMARIWELVDEALNDHRFAADRGLGTRTRLNSQTPASKFADLLAERVDVQPGLDEPWPRSPLLDEHALHAWCNNTEDDAETVVAMLALLLLLYRRLGVPARAADLVDDQDLVAEGHTLRIGMTRFFTLMHRKIMAGATLLDLAQWIINDFVIVQHERVATRKLPDDTFRFRRVGNQLRFFVQEAPAPFNDSRFKALSTVVHELGFVSWFGEPQRKLSATGRRLLRDGDLPGGEIEAAIEAVRDEAEATE